MFHPVKKEVSNKTIRLPDTLLEKMELLAVQRMSPSIRSSCSAVNTRFSILSAKKDKPVA